MNSITSASIQSGRRVQVEAAEQRVGCFNQELRPMVSPEKWYEEDRCYRSKRLLD